MSGDMSVGASAISYKDGMFVVNGQSMDLGTLMLSLNLERTQLIDSQITNQLETVKEQNDKLKALNELLTQMQSAKASGQTMSADMLAQMQQYGLTVTTVGTDKDTQGSQWDANITAVQGAQSGLNSDSQLAMTQLQQLINARNTAYDMASNALSTDQKSKDNVVSNIR